MHYHNLANQKKQKKLIKMSVIQESEVATSLLDKFIADYRRVSTDGQDLKLQIESNLQILKTEDSAKVLVYTDNGVSAYKRPLEERAELQKMVRGIEEGRIYKVVVYSRDRLARNVYEYIHLVKIFLKHKVEVILSNGSTPFTYDLMIETFFGLFAQMEGQNISQRVQEILSRYPNKMIGYHNRKNEDGKTYRYEAKGNWESEEILQLFNEVSRIEKVEDLYHSVLKYKKLLNRDGDRIMSILRTPFFAGRHLNHAGIYEELKYVDPIITFDLFLKVKEKLDIINEEFQKGKRKEKKQGRFTPLCEGCGGVMNFRPGSHGNSGIYKCKNHASNFISVSDLEEGIEKGIHRFIQGLNVRQLEITFLKIVKSMLNKELENEKELNNSIKKLALKITQNFSPLDSSKEVKELFSYLRKKREESAEVQKKSVGLQFLMKDMESLLYTFYDYMENGDGGNVQTIFFIADSIVKNIFINRDAIILDIHFNEFFQEVKN